MKSREEISRRLEALKKTRPQNDTDILYLEAALMHDMTYLKNLWCKYTLEVEEDVEILNALVWILGDDAKFGI